MVDSIVDFAESKDNFTAEHHRKVAQIAKGIAKKMNLSGERIKIIYKAGLIHDIGKINIPERTLNKSTKLIDSELEIIKTHPVIGYNILCNIRNLSPIDIIILQHHERINGTGYPYGLTGKKIILEAKIIAVADVIEAMSSERPYGSSIEIRKILNEIQDNSGILYDEKVVDACLDLFSDGEFQL